MSNFLVGLDLQDVQVDTFSGNASTTAFTLSAAATTNSAQVYISGIRQIPTSDFSISSTTISFTSPPPTASSNIMVAYTKPAIINTPADNSVTGGKLDVSLVQGDVIYASGTDTLARLAKGSATNVLTMNSGATAPEWAAASSKIVQVVNTSPTAVATGTTTMPLDDTIPQNSEGNEFMTLAITPTSASNKLLIVVNALVSPSALGNVGCALFQDSTANAIAADVHTQRTADDLHVAELSHYMTSGTTSATTFKVRVGANTSGTMTFNGSSGGRYYGGVASSSITITEISV